MIPFVVLSVIMFRLTLYFGFLLGLPKLPPSRHLATRTACVQVSGHCSASSGRRFVSTISMKIQAQNVAFSVFQLRGLEKSPPFVFVPLSTGHWNFILIKRNTAQLPALCQRCLSSKRHYCQIKMVPHNNVSSSEPCS